MVEPPRRHIAALCAVVLLGTLAGVWWLVPQEPPAPIPLTVLEPPRSESDSEPVRRTAGQAPTEAATEDMARWRDELARSLAVLDRDCAHATPTTMACEGTLCAFRNTWGGGLGNDPLLDQIRRGPWAFAERTAVHLGVPDEATRCGRAHAAVPWRPRHHETIWAVPAGWDPAQIRPSCSAMDLTWTSVPDRPEVEHTTVARLCNALEVRAGGPPNYRVPKYQ